MNRARLRAVSLFSGAGGCDIGLEDAGFEIVSSTDYDPSCVQTLRTNANREITSKQSGRHYLQGTEIIEAPIDELSASDLWQTARGKPDLLVGGPPCQPFSSAGSQRSVSESRGLLFEEFVRIADELRPKTILFENVRGLVTARGPCGVPGEALNMVRDAFEEIGYATTFALLNAADYGLPQRRVRLFMLASITSVLPNFPAPTHDKQAEADLFGELAPWVTLRDFLSGREEPGDDEVVTPSAALAKELESLPCGNGLKSAGVAEPTRPGGHWGYKQGTFIADPNLPSRTVTASSSQDWVRDRLGRLRRLTVQEAAGLQGFPDEWCFSGSRSRQYRQIGNAVPPPVTQLLGEAIATALSKARPRAKTPLSAPFPDSMKQAIAYTHKEDLRNGSARVRSPRFAGQK